MLLDKHHVISLLQKLCLTPGVSGYEEPIRQVLIAELSKVGVSKDQIEVDALGNLIVKVSEGKPHIVFMSHMDEVGFIVRDIDEKGFAYIMNIGGLLERDIISRVVVVYGTGKELEGKDILERRIYGVVGAKPTHILAMRGKRGEFREVLPEMRDLIVDFGFKSREEAEKYICIGDFGHVYKNFIELANAITCPSLDDRVGCLALLLALREVVNEDVKHGLTIVFTTQEEIGSRGSIVAAYHVKPDIVIAVDATHAVDYPLLSSRDYTRIELGKGPVICRGPPITDEIAMKIMKLANQIKFENERFNYQLEYSSGRSGTDIDLAQITREGSKAALISIPLRYMHTPIETCNIEDILLTIKLLREVMVKLR